MRRSRKSSSEKKRSKNSLLELARFGEDDPVAAFDGSSQCCREDLGVTDAVDVDPDVLAALLELLDEAADELAVAPRIGDEDVHHTFSCTGAGV
jgi:hypothetical protein